MGTVFALIIITALIAFIIDVYPEHKGFEYIQSETPDKEPERTAEHNAADTDTFRTYKALKTKDGPNYGGDYWTDGNADDRGSYGGYGNFKRVKISDKRFADWEDSVTDRDVCVRILQHFLHDTGFTVVSTKEFDWIEKCELVSKYGKGEYYGCISVSVKCKWGMIYARVYDNLSVNNLYISELESPNCSYFFSGYIKDYIEDELTQKLVDRLLRVVRREVAKYK